MHNYLSACCVYKGSLNRRWLGRGLRSQHDGGVDMYLSFPTVCWKWRDNWRVSITERLSERTKESSMTPLPELALQWCWPLHVFRHCVQKLEGELKSQHHREGLSQRTKESLMTKVHVYQQEVHMQRQLIQVSLQEHCFFLLSLFVYPQLNVAEYLVVLWLSQTLIDSFVDWLEKGFVYEKSFQEGIYLWQEFECL